MLPTIALTLAGLLVAADADTNVIKSSGALERLLKKTGVYNRSSAAMPNRPRLRPVRHGPLRRAPPSASAKPYPDWLPYQAYVIDENLPHRPARSRSDGPPR